MPWTQVLRSILRERRLVAPGDTLLDGTTLSSTKCAGRQDNVIYTSPTVRYAGLKFYAEPQSFDHNGRRLAASIVVQCRQNPGTFEMQGETMAFEQRRRSSGRGPWPGYLARECPGVDLDTIEWKSKVGGGIIPYGLLIRTYVPEDDVGYCSPLDNGPSGGSMPVAHAEILKKEAAEAAVAEAAVAEAAVAAKAAEAERMERQRQVKLVRVARHLPRGVYDTIKPALNVL